MRLDEILEALPDVGLRLWMLDQVGAGWHAAVYDPQHPNSSRCEADGETAIAAMVEACRKAGVDVADD